jgi:hypothetical protein
MDIVTIPKMVIDIITKLFSCEIGKGEVIGSDLARELRMDIEDGINHYADILTLVLHPADDLARFNLGDIISVLGRLDSVLEELVLDDEYVDRVYHTYQYRLIYEELIEQLYSEIHLDTLTGEQLTYLNFIPTEYGYVLPVCYRNIYPVNLKVYSRESHEAKLFGEVGFNEQDGVFFNYFIKAN